MQHQARIFRTRHTIVTEPLYIRLTDRSFHLINSPEPDTLNALDLFIPVHKASDHILTLFKDLEHQNETTYREMARQCFKSTIFPDEMDDIAQFPQRQHDQPTPLGALLDAGYSLFDIYHLQQETDKDEVDVKLLSVHTTPESILATLLRHNLVFGLSATADIERCVHHFALKWLEHQHEVSVIPIDDEDKAIIHQLNELKSSKRQNQIRVVHLPEFVSSDDPYLTQIENRIQAVAKDEEFGDDTPYEHLKNRVRYFFSSLLEMGISASERDTHLMFLNSFKQIKLLFDRYPPDTALFTVRKLDENPWFEVYELVLREHKFTVIFYNASLGKIVLQNRDVQESFDRLFQRGMPVVVVTQYLSAGNGVNLQYMPSDKQEKQDFTHLYLLEAPYFYFSSAEADATWEEQEAGLKENIWYQAKLYASKHISESRFRHILTTLDDIKQWNQDYHQQSATEKDAFLNNMAIFMQAMGRVERVWSKMPDQSIVMSHDVYLSFQRFCSPEFDYISEDRDPIISGNLQSVLDTIKKGIPQIERELRRKKDETLQAINERCRDAIHVLVRRLENVRKGTGDAEARKQWMDLRRAALCHDFNADILKEYGCVVESPYCVNGIVHLGPHNEIIPRHLHRPDTYRWHLNRAYNVIVDNLIIHEYFLDNGFAMAFSDQRFFTPYFYQAILLGAIGEEACVALLNDSGIALEEVPDPLFEVADLKVANHPWLIDCKNYNEYTLRRFALSPDDPAWHPKLNDDAFRMRARDKIARISAYYGSESKLIYLNLSSSQNRPYGYYTSDFRDASSFADAAIVVIQGALLRNAPNATHEAYRQFILAIGDQEG